MKKLFAIFCAVCLMPSFSAQAWVGGPFSNNSHFGIGGDDGVYEAVCTGSNTIGFMRIVIGNNFTGLQPATPPTTTSQAAAPNINGSSASGNVVIGAIGSQASTVWYSQGIAYAGRSFGSIQPNSSITGIAIATDVAVAGGYVVANTLNANFTAAFRGGRFTPSRRFNGAGVFTRTGAAPILNQGMIVLGSKVSHAIRFGT